MKKAAPLPGATEKRTASCVAVSADGRRVAAVLEEKMLKHRLYRWESTASQPAIDDIFPEGEDTLACAFTKAGTLVVGTQAGIYEVDRRGGAKKVVEGRYLWRLVADPKRERVAFADADEKVALLDLETGAVREVGEHRDRVDGLAFSPSGDRLATGSADNSVLVWDVR
jgi:WD40 repeat protein